ncbi:MAG: outer membrane protein OmpA-like peptidoglycan-associated protein [Sphingobacteriales bacterium]|jgi:outer membrane protein OmpA-like peptidoglycan-associated protein/tetratricopeptide (TPR) repeat protein
MLKRTLLASILGLVFLSFNANAQMTLKSRADRAYEDFSYSKAVELYLDIVERGNPEPLVLKNLAESYRHLGDMKSAEVWYSQVVTLRSRTPEEIFWYAHSLKANSKYGEANNWMRLFNELKPEDRRGVMHVTAGDYVSKFSPIASPYSVSNLTINGKGDDFGAALMGESVVYVSDGESNPAVKRSSGWSGKSYMDLYISDRIAGGGLSSPQFFSKAVNSRLNEGPLCFTKDELQIYFTRNNPESGKNGSNNLKIYRATLAGTDFVNVEEMPFCSNEFNVCHPTLNSEGNLLYFASDMAGGFGGYDIYKVTYDRGFWGRPANMGPVVNTEGNESFPFIHRGGKLYFSSDGHVGLGGKDIFSVDVRRATPENVENLSAPINSRADDFAFIADSSGNAGFISSNRDGGKGGDDMYAFVFAEQSDIYLLKGTVVDLNDFPIPGTLVYIKDEAGNVLGKSQTDNDGFFTFNLNRFKTYKVTTQSQAYEQSEMPVSVFPAGSVRNIEVLAEKSNFSVKGIIKNDQTGREMGEVALTLLNKNSGKSQSGITSLDGKFGFLLVGSTDYAMKIEKSGFFSKNIEFSTVNRKSGSVIRFQELNLEAIKVDQVIEIPNIYYDFGKFDIRTDAAEELDKVVDMLQDNSNVSIELGSHSDSRGSSDGNLALSQKRAESAVNYIVSKGIDRARVGARGYGESMIKNRCTDGVRCSDAEHQENRRTEIKITSVQ